MTEEEINEIFLACKRLQSGRPPIYAASAPPEQVISCPWTWRHCKPVREADGPRTNPAYLWNSLILGVWE